MQQQTFYYFAYGSNMYTRRLRGRCPNAAPVGVVYVPGKQLTFSKVSTDRAGNITGKCHMVDTANPADRVYGVLFSIPANEKAALDEAEGLGAGYCEDLIRTFSVNGTSTALVYLATHTNPVLLPYHWYKGFVERGAIEHGLPADHLAKIQAQQSTLDPNPNRRRTNVALLNQP